MDVVPLFGDRPRPTELALPARGLVVDVGSAVLMDGDELAAHGELPQLARQRRVDGVRNDREIDRHAVAPRHVEQTIQTLVVPAAVVVADEHRDRRCALIEGRADRIKPGRHTWGGPSSAGTAARTMSSAVL